MTYTPIPQGTLNWDVPVNAAFVDQNGRIDTNTAQIAANSAAITTINAKTTFVRKTADESVTNSTVLQNDDQLFLPVLNGGIYKIEGYIVYNTTSTAPAAGIQLRMTGPTGVGNWNFLGLSGGGTTDTGSVRMSMSSNGVVSTRTTSNNAGDIVAYLRGVFLPTADGTLQFEWAQQAANVAATIVRANSWLELTRVN